MNDEPRNQDIQDYDKMPKKQKKTLLIIFGISIIFLYGLFEFKQNSYEQKIKKDEILIKK